MNFRVFPAATILLAMGSLLGCGGIGDPKSGGPYGAIADSLVVEAASHKQRALRGHLIVAGLTVIGAERVKEPDTAAILLIKIRRARDALARAAKAAYEDEQRSYFNTRMFLFGKRAIVLAKDAFETRELKELITGVPTVIELYKLVSDRLGDVLLVLALRADAGEHFMGFKPEQAESGSGSSKPQPVKKDWDAVTNLLDESCQSLAERALRSDYLAKKSDVNIKNLVDDYCKDTEPNFPLPPAAITS